MYKLTEKIKNKNFYYYIILLNMIVLSIYFLFSFWFQALFIWHWSVR